MDSTIILTLSLIVGPPGMFCLVAKITFLLFRAFMRVCLHHVWLLRERFKRLNVTAHV